MPTGEIGAIECADRPRIGPTPENRSRGPVQHRPALLLALLAFTATTHASSASAALIALDLFTAGDGLVTRDTETGLDWLDLTATLNLSYNDVEADTGGWLSLGFRHATGSQVCGLFGTYAVAPAPCPGVLPVAGPVTTLQGFVGITDTGPRTITSEGAFDDGDVSIGVGQATLLRFGAGASQSQVLVDVLYATTADGTLGHWLVRPVPEPSTGLLVAAGLLAFASRRRPMRRA